MLLSIIVPLYNLKDYIYSCVNSIRSSNYSIEVIVIDDGSTDEPDLSSLKKLEKINGIKLRVYSFANGGLSEARNRGVDLAAGKYIMFLDADDQIDSDLLPSILSKLIDNELDCFFFSANVVGSGSVKFNYKRPIVHNIIDGKSAFKLMVDQDKYHVSACMYIIRTDIVKSIYFEKGIYHEDQLFTTNMLFSENISRVMVSNDKLYQRFVRGDSIMNQLKSKKHVDSYIHIYKKLNKDNFSENREMKIYLDKILYSIMDSLLKSNCCKTSFGNEVRNFVKRESRKNFSLSSVSKYHFLCSYEWLLKFRNFL